MNEITISGIIGSWAVDPEEIEYQLKNMTGDVLVLIDSVGGSVIAGVRIYNAFKTYDKGEVTFRIIGVAASIASYIVQSGDKVEAYSNATHMIHNAWLPAQGDHRVLRKSADIAEALTSIVAKAYIAKTGKPENEIRAMMDDETFHFGTEMKDAGFVDVIIEVDGGDLGKTEALALSVEKLKACNNEVMKHEPDISYEAVAQLLPKVDDPVEPEPVAADASAQLARARELEILEKGLSL